MTRDAPLVWGLVASMLIGNIILLVLILPLAPLFVAIFWVPYLYLAPGILAASLAGAYAATLDMGEVGKCINLGVLGWLTMAIPRALLVLASLMETSLRRLLLSFGSPLILVQRPIAAILLLAVRIALLLPVFGAIGRCRRKG